ncbi:MAG: NAD(P)H-dependent oxidoreductase, partial [Desulfobacterales bacterium]
MSKLFYIEASPRKERAYSIKVAQQFLNTYQETNPSHTIESFDLWQTPLPEFDGATINAKYRILHGDTHTDAEATAWNSVEELFNQFNS